ncbi:MAG TPA: signal peptidase II [Longimicrobiaceae bacterium]|nr:signal peptidase II [Longimicrobiaceae bacterium]
MTLPHRRLLAAALAAVVAADWLTKFLVQNHLRVDAFHPVVDGWVGLTHRQNPGIAFSFLRDLPDLVRLPLLTLAALVGIAAAAAILLRSRDTLARVAAGLVIAGAVGNLGDRLVNGAVTDFIQVRWFPFVFNVADVAITIGAVLLAARLALEETRGTTAPAPS